MLNFIGAAIGMALGVFLGWRRGGNRLDLLQYGAVFLIIGFLVGTFLMLLVPAPV